MIPAIENILTWFVTSPIMMPIWGVLMFIGVIMGLFVIARGILYVMNVLGIFD